MNATYLLDTNVLSEPLRPVPNRRVMQRLRRFEDRIVTASVVWHELRYGACRLPHSNKRSAIEKFLESVLKERYSSFLTMRGLLVGMRRSGRALRRTEKHLPLSTARLPLRQK